MIVGKVVGSIVSTRKSENLIGNKFMIVEPLKEMTAGAARFVAIDNIGAGIGGDGAGGNRKRRPCGHGECPRRCRNRGNRG